MSKFTVDSYGQTFKKGKPYRPKNKKKILKNIGIWIVDKLLLPIIIPFLTTVITNYYLN